MATRFLTGCSSAWKTLSDPEPQRASRSCKRPRQMRRAHSDSFKGRAGCCSGCRITFGQSDDQRTQSTPAFWEVIEGRPSTETRLCIHQKSLSKTVSLYVSVAPTDRRSVSRSQNHVYWKMSAALARNVQMLWEDPDAFLDRLEAAASFDVTRNPSRAPGNLEMLRAGTVLLGRYVSDKCVDTLYREQWALAYRHGTGD